MPDIASVLERAAAAPTRGPDIEGPRRRRKVHAVVALGCVCAVVAVGTIVASLESRSGRTVNVNVTSPTDIASSTEHSANATIDVPAGWYTSGEPLAWWLHSPFELFSIATSPLPPSPHQAANEAACPSEIPQVAVDGIADDGAYLWIGEWRPHEGLYQAETRPATYDGLMLSPGCELPRGEKAYVGIYRDGANDYSVAYVLGKDAPASRRADINRMLDSLRFDAN